MTGGDRGDYAGDVRPQQAWSEIRENPDAQLVDVRTRAEWAYVGLPDLAESGKQPLLVEWQVFPSMQVNESFVDQMRETGARPGQPLYFLCRSGARSRAAAIAMTKAGYGPCYNVADGFEGNLDEDGHRGTKEGWKAEGLPWLQK